MDYSFSIITISTGSFINLNAATQTLRLTQTISNNILHVGCSPVANFTGWNNQTDVPLFENEKNIDIYKVLNNS